MLNMKTLTIFFTYFWPLRLLYFQTNVQSDENKAGI